MNRKTIFSTCLWLLIAILTIGLILPAWVQAAEISHGQAIYHDTSPPLSEMALPAPSPFAGENKEIPIGIKPDMGRDPNDAAPDGGLQAPMWFLAPTPAPILSVPGLSEQDNVDIGLPAIVPPDTNGDIGLDDDGNRIYVQYINLVWGVFDVTGSLTFGPFAGNSFWVGFGGFCESNNDGDPVVLYDDTAGRWFFSQFSVNQGIQCVAVSQTSDPLGPYHRYGHSVHDLLEARVRAQVHVDLLLGARHHARAQQTHHQPHSLHRHSPSGAAVSSLVQSRGPFTWL